MSEQNNNWIENLPKYVKVIKNLETESINYEFSNDDKQLDLDIPHKVCELFSCGSNNAIVTLNLGDKKERYIINTHPELTGSFDSEGNNIGRKLSWSYKLA